MTRVWYPYTQMLGLPPAIEIVRGQGAWLEAADGRRFLDAISSWWVTLHGHAEPRIAQAIARQAAQLEQVILAGFTHRSAEELAERLLPLLPGNLEHLFYSDDGSTAVEVALKMALQYWQQRGQPERRAIVALEHAYHGDTLGAMAVSARSPFTAAFDWMLPPVARVPSDRLEPLERLLAERGSEFAALIMEPLLQGAGGMLVQTREFMQGVQRLCREHGVLLIADEVLTGFGRTGTMFASDSAGLAPDIVCLSKGLTAGFLPLAATACTDEIFSAFLSPDRRQTLFHGHSFTGNPLGCAAALASLDIFATEPVFERIDAIARHHAERLQRLRSHPLVAEVRQAGTVGIVALQSPAGESGYLAAIGPRLQRLCLERGVALRPLGSVVYVLPPYCITPDELGSVWDAIEYSLEYSMGPTTP